MTKLTNKELIEELKRRFQENENALFDLKVMTKKLVKINKKLEDSEALKSNFLSNIRNEINNPLTAILGLSQQLLSASELDCDSVKSMLALIHEESFNLDFQIKNIFAAAEIESGEASLGVSIVDVVTLLNNIISSFKHAAETKNIDVEMIYDWLGEEEPAILFKSDPEKLSVIVSNLLSNAIEFTNENGKVEIKLWTDGSNLKIDVKDNGIGMDNADLEIIFDRFRQLETGSTKTHKGHGLGLSIVKAVVDFLNGTVTVSSSKGVGSLFSISIPEASGPEMEGFSSEGNEFIFDDDEGEKF
ncbi:sensor histidine kinase [Candidatus Magnetominusculus xianensis]|uniref:histidine kinase n=1 Tax=Candidatus Magnetominusculus xianensis TaxID=1748249 RepID=A0ABR5SEM0_9BACT|nr:HAMP domain-containing sensor histidine kinase [Candidatus Magnetominusculus xianensis]KWT84429.1 histidine kinase [Candidatus Magnetominusculus xianensis]MBF0404263.1 HAMP domain-containing histidine kinase [Nitrospirota bacterium]